MDIRLRDFDDDFMDARFNAAIEGVRFFAMQYGTNCEVLERKGLREMLKADIAEIARKNEV